MKKLSILLFLIVMILVPKLAAQNIELVYTNSVMNLALDYKDEFKSFNAKATNALSLANISDARKDAYLKSIDGFTAILIIGETSLKAVSNIDYSQPVIVVNANGSTSAKGPKVRIFDHGQDCKCESPSKVNDINSLGISKADLSSGNEIVLTCEGVSSKDVTSAILAMLK